MSYYLAFVLHLILLSSMPYVTMQEHLYPDDDLKTQETLDQTDIETSISLLKRLPWNTTIRPFKEKLPVNSSLPQAFYQNVYLINKLAIFADDFYKSSENKYFLNYLMALAYTSESFLWKQPGLLQSYYDRGIPWISGTKVNSSIDKQFAALSSAAGDVLILFFVLSNVHPSLGLWAAQEQQVLASKNLLSKPWMWPVVSPSNPVMFRDKKTVVGSNPDRHTFVLGPLTWLSLSLDLYAWIRLGDKAEIKYQSYVIKGAALWARLSDNKRNNIELIKEIPASVNLQNLTFPCWVNKLLTLKFSDHEQDHDFNDFSYLIKGKKSLREAQKYLEEYDIKRSKQKIQDFYCGPSCQCSFIPALDCF